MLPSELAANPEIDVVAIATPPSAQVGLALEAMDAGKAVFAEKPFAVTVEEARALVGRAEATGATTAVDFTFGELTPWRQARALIASGKLGRLRHLFLDWRMESFDNRHGIEGWKTRRSDGGGVLSHFGSHSFYYLEWLAGPIVGLQAKLSSAPGCGSGGDTLAVLAMQFASGLSGSMTLCSAAHLGTGHRLEIYGDSGTLHLVNDGPDPMGGFRLLVGGRDASGLEDVTEAERSEAPAGEDPRVGPVHRLVARFLDAVEAHAQMRPAFQDGLRAQELLAAASRSDERGRWLDVRTTPAQQCR